MQKFEYKFEIEAETEVQANEMFRQLMEHSKVLGAEIVAFDVRRATQGGE